MGRLQARHHARTVRGDRNSVVRIRREVLLLHGNADEALLRRRDGAVHRPSRAVRPRAVRYGEVGRGQGAPQDVLAVDGRGGGVLPHDVGAAHPPRQRQGRRAGRLHPEGKVHIVPCNDRALDRLWTSIRGSTRAQGMG